MKKRLANIVAFALIVTLVIPMTSFASVAEIKTDTTVSGKSLAGKYPTYDDIKFQYSLTEEATHKVTIPTKLESEALKEAVKNNTITFSLDRDSKRTYLDPALYPFASKGGPVSEWKDKEGTNVINVEKIEVKGKNLVVTFKTAGTEFYYTDDATASDEIKKIYSIDHTNGGRWLDKCGYFNLNAKVGKKTAGSVHAKVVPYDSYRTPYELFNELEELKAYKGKRYVEVGSVGHTTVDKYDTPYVIVASDKKAVQKWLEYTELSETQPEKVLKDIKAGKYDNMKVPLYISNLHTNENSAVNGILNTIQDLVNKNEVSLKTLESYTELGRETLEKEKSEVFKTGLSKIYGEWATELGRLRGENGDTKSDEQGVSYGYSSVVDFDKYYKTGVDKFTIDELLKDVFFVCVPTMNMEGYVQQTRATGVGFDPNRDYANQTMNENANAMAFMAKWNPMVYTEIHGRVEGMLIEPCGAPHNPNIEYDLIGEKFLKLGEAVGNAAVANNEKFNSYELPARDYIELDPNSTNPDNKVQWGTPWDDLSTNFGSQFPVFYGTCGITWEMPAYDDITSEQVIPNGLLGQGRFVQKNKKDLLISQAELFARGLANENSNDKVAKYYVNQYDVPNSQADIMRPVYDGKDQNGNFYPECFIIPMDKKNQKNIQDAAEAVKWIARNDMKYKVAQKPFEYDGVKYPAGTVIASMYQAKRSLLHAHFGPGTFVTVWKGLYSEAFSQHPYARGFDIVTVAEPAAYKAIDAVCKDGYDYKGTIKYLSKFSSQFSGVKNADVIISNASEDTALAVNELLKEGRAVAMITEGEYMGDFICSYDDYKTITKKYLLSAEGVKSGDIKASLIGKSPKVYITGGYDTVTEGNIELPGGNAYCFDLYAMKQMGFTVANKASEADIIIGANFGAAPEDAKAKEEVLKGTPYMVWGSGAGLSGILEGVKKESMPNGTDALVNVKYPEITLLNANYHLDGDDQNYQYGTDYFSAVPKDAKVIVQNAGKTPMVGCVGIFNKDDEAAFEKYNNAPVAFEYTANGLDIAAFANSLTHKGHPQDEFKYIANFMFSRSFNGAPYSLAKELSKLTPEAKSVKTAKGNVIINVNLDKNEKAAIAKLRENGYAVKFHFYRSTAKGSKYQSKLYSEKTRYINTVGKKGTTYYYKARVQVYDKDGVLLAKTSLNQCKYATRKFGK